MHVTDFSFTGQVLAFWCIIYCASRSLDFKGNGHLKSLLYFLKQTELFPLAPHHLGPETCAYGQSLGWKSKPSLTSPFKAYTTLTNNQLANVSHVITPKINDAHKCFCPQWEGKECWKLILKLELASECPAGFVKQIAGPHPQRFWFGQFGAGSVNLNSQQIP